jgi:hypothetical protein
MTHPHVLVIGLCSLLFAMLHAHHKIRMQCKEEYNKQQRGAEAAEPGELGSVDTYNVSPPSCSLQSKLGQTREKASQKIEVSV